MESAGAKTLKGLLGSWPLFVASRRRVISVAIAEDNVLVREGISTLLRSIENVRLVAVCSDFHSIIEAVEAKAPDVVITDVRMPPSSTDEGYEVARLLAERHPEIGVIVLSQHADPTKARELFETRSAGRAFLLKENVASREVVTHVLEIVADGGTLLDPALPGL
jgi:DNA-binding NarL/FixJ family response regulator